MYVNMKIVRDSGNLAWEKWVSENLISVYEPGLKDKSRKTIAHFV